MQDNIKVEVKPNNNTEKQKEKRNTILPQVEKQRKEEYLKRV